MNDRPVPILEKGEGTVYAIRDSKMKGRLISLGIIKGKPIRILRSTAFGGAYYVLVDRHSFGMRKEELDQILVV